MEQVNTVDEYLKKLSRYDIYTNVFYRGQLEKYKSITSSISRNEGYEINESSIYAEAVRMRSIEFDGLFYPIERLSKMQHYGIPTRLVDLTIDPLIGLFFAVQNVDDKSHGNVYVFVQQEHSLKDKRIKLLSLLATVEPPRIDLIKSRYIEYFAEDITESEILKFASEGAFIKHSDELQKSNERLFCQKGTFAICGNKVENNEITKSILPLDSINPTMVIRIPFEHKQAIKRELDEKHNINETTIYPEFPSVADYLKEKYRKVTFDMEGTYEIVQVQDTSFAGAKRCSIVAVLKKIISIEEVKHIGKQIIDEFKKKNDVVWVYIAKNGDDYIMKNWMIRGQWVSEKLNSKFRPYIIGEADEFGYIWRFEKSYSTLADYYDEYAFEEDKILFIQNMKTFESLKPYYEYMLSAFENGHMKDFQEYVFNNESEIKKLFLKLGDYGHSKNDNFNKYLDHFQEIALELSNVALWLKKEKLTMHAKKYQISKSLKNARIHYDAITENAPSWQNAIGLSDEEYEKTNLNKIKRKKYQYKQTIPLNPGGVEVAFYLDIIKNEDNSISIKGKTNLFDKASLLLSIRNSDGLLMGQSKTIVENGRIDFGKLSNEAFGTNKGKYVAHVTGALPSVQDKEFVRKAGIEYENLKGKCIDRTGVGPTIKYRKEFEI